MKPKKTHMAVLISILLLVSCNQPTPSTQVASSTNTIPIDSIPILQAIDTVANNITTQTDTTTNVKKTPQKPTNQDPPNTNKNKPDKKEAPPPKKHNSNFAKENTPQKIIGNEYFEVVEGCYCNDIWDSNTNSVSSSNCRFCRDFFIKNKSKEHLFFKEVWCGNSKKEVNMWAEAAGVGEHIVFCTPKLNTGFEIPPPIPYQGQALISYAVSDPNAEIRYFDVTNLIKWCGRFYQRHPTTPQKKMQDKSRKSK